jgi:HEAT repeat protein
MSTMLTALLCALFLPLPQAAAPGTNPMQVDVDRLVRAAENLTDTWPSQEPPAIPEVSAVARHGRAVVPLLMPLLSDDPHAERDRKRWTVQQQVSLTLSRIYGESSNCGRIYCDGDPTERIARVRAGWLRVIAADEERRSLSSKELVARFKQEKVSWQQMEIAKALAATNERSAIAELEPWLTHEDRHLRGNAAFVLGRLGDPRGFDTIVAILADRSPRAEGQGHAAGRWSVDAQIRADRYYAAHLLGHLKDPRGVDVLVPLLSEPDASSVVPWSLSQIGDPRAIAPLIAQLDRDDPSIQVLVILALETLNAREALPRLRELLQNSRPSNFGGRTSVADAAKRAIAVISQQ